LIPKAGFWYANMDEADRMADRVAIIDHGSLLVLDTPEVIKHNVGKGDVLEIDVGDSNEPAQKACTEIKAITDNVSLKNGSLIIRAPGVIELLPGIIQIVKSSGITPGDIRLRHNSLEDVFITLTGRRLRE
jgi:ABC-2 type transport system ATP-binding protein